MTNAQKGYYQGRATLGEAQVSGGSGRTDRLRIVCAFLVTKLGRDFEELYTVVKKGKTYNLVNLPFKRFDNEDYNIGDHCDFISALLL